MSEAIERLFALDGPVASERAVVAAEVRSASLKRLADRVLPMLTIGAYATCGFLVAVALASTMGSQGAHIDMLFDVLIANGVGIFCAGMGLELMARRAERARELLDPIVECHEREIIDMCEHEPQLAHMRNRITAVRPMRRGDFRALRKEFERLRGIRLHLTASLLREHTKPPVPAPAPATALGIDPGWVAHAYPLQQIVIRLQGTRHSDRAAIISQLEEILERLRAGHLSGAHHDDDFGYDFQVDPASIEPSFFDQPADRR